MAIWIRAKVDAKELAMGTEIEKEHLDTIKWLVEQLGGDVKKFESLRDEAAERIARDHLKELPDYYTRLKKMESGQ
jgi:hypothetical protein